MPRRIFLRALVNLDPYEFIDDVAQHFAEGDENNQQSAEEVLTSTLAQTPDEKLTSFALRLALTEYVDLPRESELDFLAQAESAFAPPPPARQKKAKKEPTPIKSASNKKATKKKVAA